MVDLTHLQQIARVVRDENGKKVVQIPFELWEELLGQIEHQPSQIEQIMAVLREFESEPDDKSDEWWDEFNAFLKANRLNFEERDLGFDNE
jgi:hypothetical protein